MRPASARQRVGSRRCGLFAIAGTVLCDYVCQWVLDVQQLRVIPFRTVLLRILHTRMYTHPSAAT